MCPLSICTALGRIDSMDDVAINVIMTEITIGTVAIHQIQAMTATQGKLTQFSFKRNNLLKRKLFSPLCVQSKYSQLPTLSYTNGQQ